VVLDRKIDKMVPVVVDLSQPPDGLTVGEVKIDPEQVKITGASALVNTVVSARIGATVDASALNIDREIQAQAVDANGAVVSGVDLEPDLVHLVVPVIQNLDNRTVPVSPVITGSPGAGFRIAAVTVDPEVVTVQGDADVLSQLVSADTAPVMVFGATRTVTAEVAYALPPGVTPVGAQTAKVTVKIEAVNETRTFTAGIRLDGRDPDLLYAASDESVLLTVYGSIADLDRLGASPIVISLNVANLGPGAHVVQVVPSLSSVLTVAAIDPQGVTVTVSPRPTPTPEPTASPTTAPSGEAASATPGSTPAP
jgi:YbbR domain-containing protein